MQDLLVPPSLLYSYRPARADLTREREILLGNKVWFSTPDQFNDPFELRPHFHFSDNYEPPQEVVDRFAQLLPSGLRGIAVNAIKDHFSDPAKRDAMKKRISANLYDALHTTSIACFAEDAADIRMWSYYASSHKGICIGYSFKEPWKAGSITLTPEKVIYQKEYPRIMLEATMDATASDPDARKKALLTKAEEWSGEREWRCIRPMIHAGHQAIPPHAVCSVVLGARIESSQRDAVLAMLKERAGDVRVYQARIADDRFEIAIDPF